MTVVQDPIVYFQGLVTDGLKKQGLHLLPETQIYLVNLLVRFMLTKNLYQQDQNGHTLEQPLALMFKEALEQEHPQIQGSLFRNLGDTSLYLSGFFQESLQKRNVNLSYYIGMGQNAYNNASQLMSGFSHSALREVLTELSDRFSQFVNLLYYVRFSATTMDLAPPSRTKNSLLDLELSDAVFPPGTKKH